MERKMDLMTKVVVATVIATRIASVGLCVMIVVIVIRYTFGG